MATATAQLQCTPCNNINNRSSSTAIKSPSTTSPQEVTSHHSTQWHFPGPSSRFNQRERASTQSRANLADGGAPLLHTERRAHRRAHSSYNLPTSVSHHEYDRPSARKSLNARFTSPNSPSSSFSGRSPLSRFHSFTSSSAMAVVTPVRASHAKLHDSPYSDYFTDDNRSIDEVASQTLPALETQQLLVRLNKLQSALMRGGNDSQALYLVGRRMSEIENDMESLHSQSRQPPELDDSGLFMAEADEDEEEEKESVKEEPQKQSYDTFDGANDERPPPVAEIKTENDSDNEKKTSRAERAHIILATVSKAHRELQQRFEELKKLRERHQKEIHEKEMELQALRTENEHMQQDLNLDHGDFVLLDGQLRLIQNQVLRVDGATDGNLNLAIDAMRADCRKAIEKVNNKRVRYSNCRARSGDQYDEGLKLGRWKMDVVRHPTGRVDSMVLERLSTDEQDARSHFEISEVSAKLVDRRLGLLYTDQGSQVTVPIPTDSSISDAESEESYESSHGESYDPREELRQTALEDELYLSDCAITTSPPSELGGSTTDHENMNGSTDSEKGTTNTKARNAHKTAWHELWDGLAELAGVGEHRW